MSHAQVASGIIRRFETWRKLVDQLAVARAMASVAVDSGAMTVHLVEHALVVERLTRLRSIHTSNADFRRILNELSRFVLFEAMRDLPMTKVQIDTPLESTSGVEISTHPLLVPVMRAGLGMLDAALELLPDSGVGFIGLKRDEETLLPHAYANTVPDDLAGAPCIVLDPMLATGGSLVHTCDLLRAANAGEVTVACILSSPEGLEAMGLGHPDIDVWTAAIDSSLNDVGFIRPGLGDAGDRQYGIL